MDPILRLSAVSKIFTVHSQHRPPKTIVGCENIHITLNLGEFAGITGTSGSGKSSLLKCIYRTYKLTSGRIDYFSSLFGWVDLASLDEQRILQLRKREIGYVSQFLNVIPRVSAKDLVAAALEEAGADSIAAGREAERVLGHFRLKPGLWDAYPNAFSGGEKLRLNLAQAMVRKPKLLLLDEPTASLDQDSKAAVKDLIIELKQTGTSMIGIFHDLDFMAAVVDTTHLMKEGRLYPEIASNIPTEEEAL
jgi:alpha-D-ribose 1-methylphosphonate 5-triphosphate synthase subunit PhnL